MPRKQMNIGLTLEQRNRVDAVSAAEGTTPTEFARAAILEAVQLHHALTAEEREQVALAAEVDGLSVTAFCRAAILEAAAPAEHGAGVDADGVGFLAWADGCTFCHTSWPRYPGIAWLLVGVAGVLRGSAMRWNIVDALIFGRSLTGVVMGAEAARLVLGARSA